MAGGIYELYKDVDGNFRFRLKSPTGETIVLSEGYSTKVGAERAIQSLRMTAPLAFLDDQT